MAAKIDDNDLKRLALLKIAEARSELSAQSERLRKNLNPKSAARRLLDQHTGAVALTAFAAGLVVTILLFRDRPHGDAVDSGRDRHGRRTRKIPGAGLLGVLIRAAAPALVKIAIAKPLDHLFAERGAVKPDFGV